MLMLALIQFPQHVEKAYTFTDHKEHSPACRVQWYKEPLFVDPFEHLRPIQASLCQ